MIIWSEEEILFVKALVENENCPSWIEVARQYNKKFKDNLTGDAVSSRYRRVKAMEESDPETVVFKTKQIHSARRSARLDRATLKHLLNYQEMESSVLEKILDLTSKIKSHKPPKPPKSYPDKFNMTLELMLSDLHYGKLIIDEEETVFNEEVARKRMRELTSVFMKELVISQKHYNVERIIIPLLGDMIESFEMHVLESARGCEYGTAKQIWACIDSLLFDVFIPIAELGIPIDVPAVTGNHDRSDTKKTFSNPGHNNWTFIIYKTLESMLLGRGYTNMNFYIPSSPYTTLEIYGKTILYEHFDNAGKNSREAIEKLMRKRSQQTGSIVHMARGGHFHDQTMYGNGEIIVNGSLPGNDSFADVLGYTSSPSQVLNYYLDFEGRGERSPFHKTFGIKLK